ncbi:MULTISPECIES: type II toxin-antitoxin system Phd/YefM family antitoxin [Arthrobacter]|uniref:Antitoxin n=1 Tax=Arthrobacter terricola TaxID=2547396 RepID=A0A4V2ZSU6_9MICC|nr:MULTISPECIES: type II toxin-antitoxin system prevent-host-death family antitoxin [Arthrobacter]MBT8162035.1 type II toxin-antitoxin system prevent-host-death family antitoxin [Arthrobacter sp. GN70]TDF94574.1 type II toxin-antitoxin system prevent-host-death family antitoxin [Arthrobacter terricola]
MAQYNVQEAKTRLSELLHMVERGEEVVIAKAGKPVARLVRVELPRKRELGFLGQVDLPDNLFDPLTEQELAEWE